MILNKVIFDTETKKPVEIDLEMIVMFRATDEMFPY